MNKKIIALILVAYITASYNTAHAITRDVLSTNRSTIEVKTQLLAAEDTEVVDVQAETIVDKEDIDNSAGVLPGTLFYTMERAVERLQIAITQSEEKLATLKAQFAVERAAEAAIMTGEGKEELVEEATSEYEELLTSAAEHISKAIDAKNEAVETLQSLNGAYNRSEMILKSVLEKAPETVKAGIENVLVEQDKAISAVNGFYTAKKAFFVAKEQLEMAKKELKAAKESGDVEAIRIAEEKVTAAEALKDELESLKDAVDSAKEEVMQLVEQVEKRIESGNKQIEKAKDKMEKVEKKAAEDKEEKDKEDREDAEKLAEKVEKVKEKEIEKAKKEEEKSKKKEEKSREALKKAEEKAREKAKKAAEKAGDDEEHKERD